MYIACDFILEEANTKSIPKRKNQHIDYRGWVTSRVTDWEQVAECLRKPQATRVRMSLYHPDLLANQFEEDVTGACDQALPRRKAIPDGKRPVHW